MTLQSELIAGAGFAAAFAAIVAVGEAWQRLKPPRPGWTRKFVHGASGLVCLFLPEFIHSSLTVLALAMVCGVTLWAGQRIGLLRGLAAVSRRSYGSEIYGAAVFLAFWLSGGVPWIYWSGVLVLALADLAAAAIGVNFGKRKYAGFAGHTKSLEGSLACFAVAFAAVFGCAALAGGMDAGRAALLALLAALAATALEAIGVWGSDNLLMPAGVCLLLHISATAGSAVPGTWAQLLLLGGPIIVMLIVAWLRAGFGVRHALLAGVLVYFGWLAWVLPVGGV